MSPFLCVLMSKDVGSLEKSVRGNLQKPQVSEQELFGYALYIICEEFKLCRM